MCQPRSDAGSTLAASSAETTGARNGQRGAFVAYLDGSIIGRCCNCIGTHEVNAGIAIADNAAISDIDIAECHIGTGSDENLQFIIIRASDGVAIPDSYFTLRHGREVYCCQLRQLRRDLVVFAILEGDSRLL